MNRSVWSEGKVMATETESWECMKDNILRLESVASCAIIVSYSDSAIESSLNGLASRGLCRKQRSSPGFLFRSAMHERIEQRKQSRKELEMRYECARKQREHPLWIYKESLNSFLAMLRSYNSANKEEKRMKEELKLTLDKLRRKAMSEQNRAALRKHKQLERKAQQRRELLRQQRELASLHNFRRILLHYGSMPWYRFLLHCRIIGKKAVINYDLLPKRRTLNWLHRRRIQRESSPELSARGIASLAQRLLAWWRLKYFWYSWIEGRRGEHHYRQFLLKRSCKGLKEILEYRRTLDQIGDERNQLRLLSGAWLKWTAHIKKEKRSQLLKYLEIDQIAFLHWQRVTYVKILRAWKEGMGIVRYEQKRSQHKAEAWTKIHFWLDEH